MKAGWLPLLAAVLALGSCRGGDSPGVERGRALIQAVEGIGGEPGPGNAWVLWVVFSLDDCGACLGEAAVWEALDREGLRLMGVGRAEDPRALEDFCRDEGLDFPVYHDPEGEVAESLGIPHTPYKLLIHPTGRVVFEDGPNNSPRRHREFQQTVLTMTGIQSSEGTP